VHVKTSISVHELTIFNSLTLSNYATKIAIVLRVPNVSATMEVLIFIILALGILENFM
jgi:hypothetical protein